MSYQRSKGRLLDIYKIVEPGTISQGSGAFGRKNGQGCTGGNGTFANWDNGQRYLYVKVSVYADKLWHYIDILDETLDRTGWTNLTTSRIQRLRDANFLKKVSLERWGNGEWQFADLDELDFNVD